MNDDDAINEYTRLSNIRRSEKMRMEINGAFFDFKNNNNIDDNDNNVRQRKSNDDDSPPPPPIKVLKLMWSVDEDDEEEDEEEDEDEWTGEFDYEGNFYPTVEFNYVWKLKHIEKLILVSFPHAVMTTAATTTVAAAAVTTAGEENKNNFSASTTTTSSSTTTTPSMEYLSKTLKELTFSFCYHIDFLLPSGLWKLDNLTKLSIRSCHRLESIPSGIGNLVSLQKLELESMSQVQHLPPEIGQLKNLQYFSLFHCRLVDIPNEIGNLESLHELHIISCPSLERLPTEFNNLCETLKTLHIYGNSSMQPSGFSFDLGNFTKLQDLRIGWRSYLNEGEVEMSLLQNLPKTLEKLGLYDFYCEDLSTLIQRSIPTTTTAAGREMTAGASTSLMAFLPRDIKELYIEDLGMPLTFNICNPIVIKHFLQVFPRLSIKIFSKPLYKLSLLGNEEKSLGLLPFDTLHLMFWNRCGRVLFKHAVALSSLSQQQEENSKRPLPLSVWPIVLEQVRKRIGPLANNKSEQIMEASIIFTMLHEGPAWMERSTGDFFFV